MVPIQKTLDVKALVEMHCAGIAFAVMLGGATATVVVYTVWTVEATPFGSVVAYTERTVETAVVTASVWTGAWMVLVTPSLTTTITVFPAPEFCPSEEELECVPDAGE
jgi:hypothetical protein